MPRNDPEYERGFTDGFNAGTRFQAERTPPSDAEQLSELRKAGTRMLEVLETYKERHLVPSYFVNALADLRDTLGDIDRTATVQCADCLAWFDKNSNHTCAKQVKANRRRM